MTIKFAQFNVPLRWSGEGCGWSLARTYGPLWSHSSVPPQSANREYAFSIRDPLGGRVLARLVLLRSRSNLPGTRRAELNMETGSYLLK